MINLIFERTFAGTESFTADVHRRVVNAVVILETTGRTVSTVVIAAQESWFDHWTLDASVIQIKKGILVTIILITAAAEEYVIREYYVYQASATPDLQQQI